MGVHAGLFADNPLSLHRVLHKLEDEGYRGIELGAAAPHPTRHVLTRHSCEQVKKEVADHGLAFSGWPPIYGRTNLVSVEDWGRTSRHSPLRAVRGRPRESGAIRVDTVEPLTVLQGVDPNVFDRTTKAFDCVQRLPRTGASECAGSSSRIC